MQEFTQSTSQSFMEQLALAPIRLIAALIVPAITMIGLYYSFIFLRDAEASKIVVVSVALIVGIGGVWALYYSADLLVNALFSDRWQNLVRPFVFVGPAMAVLFFFLVYPALRSFYLSLFNNNGSEFIGFDNYIFALTNPVMLEAIRNSLLWIILVPVFSLIFGLITAVLADRVRFESAVKSIIFLPMAISFVGASVIWRFVYAFSPGEKQIGVLNALLGVFGADPIGWTADKQGIFNAFGIQLGEFLTWFTTNVLPGNALVLIIILIWLQTGFAMVLLSAAIKGVPSDIIEAARIDGANEIQVFFRVIIPYIRPTIVTVTTTILILSLKTFDIVWVMTNGNFGTEVVASRLIKEIARFRDFGRGSAIAMVLLLATVPVMIYNIRNIQKTEELR